MNAGLRWAPVVGMIAALAVSVAAANDPPDAPATQPAPDPAIDRILTRLEARTVDDLHARITWERRYDVAAEDETDVKIGELWYKRLTPISKFKVAFSRKVVANRRIPLDEQYLFDGLWFTELNAQARTVIRREVRRPDDPVNPYKLGEGPFPLPFGQKKEDILAEFTVTLVPPAKDDPADTDQLRLVPRAGTQTEKRFSDLRFWIVRTGALEGLPIRVMAAQKSGTGRVDSYSTLSFDEVKLNTGFSAGTFEIRTPGGFEEVVERLEPIVPPPAERS
jgi:hypothetical protein